MVVRILNRSDGGSGVYVGRPSRFGNPYRVGEDGTREQVIALYREYFAAKSEFDSRFREALEALYAKVRRHGELNLVCWCAPKPCHAEVIAEWIVRRGKEEGLEVRVEVARARSGSGGGVLPVHGHVGGRGHRRR